MSLNAFEFEVLGRAVSDYEAVHTIRADIARDLGRVIEVEEVIAAFVSLTRASLLDAFKFDQAKSSYCRVSIESGDATGLWFLANANGISRLENNESND